MDWTKVIREILETGLAQQQVADLCGCSQAHVSYLLNGERKRPSFDVGVALLNLHKRLCVKKTRKAA